jgi:hypothetical protein
MPTIIGTLPNIISDGQLADAAPVMADFNWIVNQVNANAQPTLPFYPGALVNVQNFLASATYTPTTGATKAYVILVGCGGGGGGAAPTAGGQCSLGSGGNAGCYVEGWIPSGLVATTVSVSNLGGAGGVGASNGATGTTTSFGTIFVAPGGVGGLGSGAFAPPFAQGPVAQNAAPSGSGTLIVATFGSLGGFGTALTGASAIGGKGGDSPLGTGGFGGQGNSNGQGGFRLGAGGGGASALSSNGSGTTGGAGAGGQLIVFEYA